MTTKWVDIIVVGFHRIVHFLHMPLALQFPKMNRLSGILTKKGNAPLPEMPCVDTLKCRTNE